MNRSTAHKLFLPLLLAAALSAAPVASAFGASTGDLLTDDFESSTPGAKPNGWSLAGTIAGTSATVISGTSGNATRLVQLHDDNGATTANNTLFRAFTRSMFGSCVARADIKLSSTHAAFAMRLTNGSTPTSGPSWAATVLFQGDGAYTDSPAPGALAYQQITVGAGSYILTNPLASFSADTWYTVRIDAYSQTQTYKVFFGPRGGALTEVTPPGGVPFVHTTPGERVDSIAGITFFTSNKTGDAAADLFIDNVTVSTSVPVASSVYDAKTTPKNTQLQIIQKVVTAGTDQLGKPFCYIQDDSGGIRVRTTASVRQGDRISVLGTSQRASDNGVSVLRNGEREISASAIVQEIGTFPLPTPIGVTNRDAGGSAFPTPPQGPIDTDGYPFQPGVWAGSTGANGGYDQIDAVGLSNVGRLARVWGKVVWADNAARVLIIDDGSKVRDGSALPGGAAPPNGIRILVPPGLPLSGLTGRFMRLTGIVGSISQAEVGAPQGPSGNYIRNVRVIRALAEPFIDSNANGFRDATEIFVDTNRNGVYDGIVVEGVPGTVLHTRFTPDGVALVEGEPFYPLGVFLYDWSSYTQQEVVQQGFNTVLYAVTAADAPSLHNLGLMAVPYATNDWLAIKNDPAILAWYLYDEPEGHGISPATALQEYQRVQGIDPSHPIGMAHFLYDALTNYANAEDFVMSDVYPLTAPGPASIWPMASHIDRIHTIHGLGYPVWPAIQVFGGPETEGGKWALPTPDQARAMTYLAVTHHVTGMLFFSFKPQYPDLWAEVKVLIAELKQLSPFFLLPGREFAVGQSDPSIQTRGVQVGQSGLIIAMNLQPYAVASTLMLPNLPVTSLSQVFIGGSVTPINNVLSYTFQPYEVKIFQWGPTPAL